jgi:hypothetical protein
MNTILTIVLAVLVAVFLGGFAIAEDNSDALGGEGIYGPSISQVPSEGSASSQLSFSGEVVSVDLSNGTLTVEPISEDETLPGKVKLSTDEMTRINLCNNSMSLADINVGDNLHVQYHLKDGSYVAEGIDSAQPC